MAKTETTDQWKAGSVLLLVAVVAGLVVAGVFLGRDDGVLDEWERRERVNPMEFSGRWLGLTVVPTDCPTARQWGIVDGLRGVLVIEIARREGQRATQAGVTAGDVVTAIEDMKVKNLEGFYKVTRKVDTNSTILLDIDRNGQLITLVLADPNNTAGSAQSPASASGLSPVPSNDTQLVTFQNPWPSPSANSPVYQGATPQVSWFDSTQAWGPSEQWYQCPLHGTRWPGSSVHPHYRCPLCNGALTPCASQPGTGSGR